MPQLNLHISQLLSDNYELQADGDRGLIHIQCRALTVFPKGNSKGGKYWVAESAREYWIEDEDVEKDEEVRVGVAIAHLTHGIPASSENVDGRFAVVRKIDTYHWDLRVLVWKENPDDKTFSAMEVQPKS
jgi:hypothetical protein